MENYRHQVELLLQVLPLVAKKDDFALHGGTAINLFVRNLPRLSVDIDLTYLPLKDRLSSFQQINKLLSNIKRNILDHIPNSKVTHQKDILKLQISQKEAQIKLEVNQGMRGVIGSIEQKTLVEAAQERFDAFCVINLVPFHQLYGGKICAALDRQHPRDLFDVKYLLANEGFTDEVKTGFIFSLLSSNRPMEELLFPHLIDQQQSFENQFKGMTYDRFNYDEFLQIRNDLISIVQMRLSEADKQFLISFESLEPNWHTYNFEQFPAVQWKLQNLRKLKEINPQKYLAELNSLKEKLGC